MMNEKAPSLNNINDKIQKLKQLNAKLDAMLEQKKVSVETYKEKNKKS